MGGGGGEAGGSGGGGGGGDVGARSMDHTPRRPHPPRVRASIAASIIENHTERIFLPNSN